LAAFSFRRVEILWAVLRPMVLSARDGDAPDRSKQALGRLDGAMRKDSATVPTFVPSIAVPAGFTRDNLPKGITFLGRPYNDAKMIQLVYAYEQATQHRRTPATIS
jgi:Asp-tRNA(Asn)/Glu-tRNA(Gln) amidotransferase A subunit family amidase